MTYIPGNDKWHVHIPSVHASHWHISFKRYIHTSLQYHTGIRTTRSTRTTYTFNETFELQRRWNLKNKVYQWTEEYLYTRPSHKHSKVCVKHAHAPPPRARAHICTVSMLWYFHTNPCQSSETTSRIIQQVTGACKTSGTKNYELLGRSWTLSSEYMY